MKFSEVVWIFAEVVETDLGVCEVESVRFFLLYRHPMMNKKMQRFFSKAGRQYLLNKQLILSVDIF